MNNPRQMWQRPAHSTQLSPCLNKTKRSESKVQLLSWNVALVGCESAQVKFGSQIPGGLCP